MLDRRAEARLRDLSGRFPAVLILGPRQCGKTTLVRMAVRGDYYDLERPSSLQVFLGDPELALGDRKGPVVLDEAQVLPSLFPVIRSLIDQDRRPGRFILLGSVNPDLVRGLSETLAGRVGILELTPFLFPEVERLKKGDFRDLWLGGGFPGACLTRDAGRRRDWLENYLRTFVERDVARQGLRLTPVEMHRLLSMLAHGHGGLLNASSLGRSLGCTYHTVQKILDVLEGHFLVRRLLPWSARLGRRLVKAPKVYLRDSGILHHLLGIETPRQLLESPARGASWEGFLIEQVVSLESLVRPGSRYYFFRTQAGMEIDLVVERGAVRIGCEFKAGLSVGPEDWKWLKAGIDLGVIREGLLVYGGDRSFRIAGGIQAVAAGEVLRNGLRGI